MLKMLLILALTVKEAYVPSYPPPKLELGIDLPPEFKRIETPVQKRPNKKKLSPPNTPPANAP